MKVFIFCRYPELGKVKTRIAKDIGDSAALAVYKRMLKIVFANITDSGYSFEVHCTGGIENDRKEWLQNIPYQAQVGGDLGDKLSHAAEKWFSSDDEPLVFIGADQLEVDRKILSEAEQLLSDNDFVIGPAEDGGYYLIGMNSYTPQIFNSISWGTAAVFQETLDRISDAGLSYGLLPVKSDMDYLEDLPEEWQKEMMVNENSSN